MKGRLALVLAVLGSNAGAHQFQDDFESGVLTGDGGRWAQVSGSPGIGIGSTAAHRYSLGLCVATGVVPAYVAAFDAGTGATFDRFVHYWVRLPRGTAGSAWLSQLEPAALRIRADWLPDGGATLALEGFQAKW